jgi:Fe-S-cluster-containing hydrogenase component 2
MLAIHPERCNGCRICELACSFHFLCSFDREISAIEVRRHESEGRFMIFINTKTQGRRNVCDSCTGEEKPLCVKYCTAEALDLR